MYCKQPTMQAPENQFLPHLPQVLQQQQRFAQAPTVQVQSVQHIQWLYYQQQLQWQQQELKQRQFMYQQSLPPPQQSFELMQQNLENQILCLNHWLKLLQEKNGVAVAENHANEYSDVKTAHSSVGVRAGMKANDVKNQRLASLLHTLAFYDSSRGKRGRGGGHGRGQGRGRGFY
ncbi:hypothetical protein TSAR_013524 [Trichomalopsis sarcophagae]|uniref:Uncharacterized protein n=1 Tax=Trichomalopsis sarcophagae TaxID=543379 RepID=A0A232FC46_9HYME|nr:hypothetical protein TSAR_013524 [Trichomalopsis sarcophagae]